MDAAGLKVAHCVSTPIQLLQNFSVGTELGKRIVPPPPDPSLLGPLRNCKRVSPEEVAIKRLKLKTSPDETDEATSDKNDNNVTVGSAPDYLMIWRLSHGISQHLRSRKSEDSLH